MSTAKPSAAPFVPPSHTLPVLREAVQQCHGCDLYRNATQAVFGELLAARRTRAGVMMVGEQPGDKEDLQGRPFVGPAGKFLDDCLEKAGIDRTQVYVTNAVKHFKWEPRGKLRIHKKPSLTEIRACRPWLDAELDAVKPKLIVCLGAVAAQGLLGASFRVTVQHGQLQQVEGKPPVIATLHPAAILRARTDEDRYQQTEILLSDLHKVAGLLASLK